MKSLFLWLANSHSRGVRACVRASERASVRACVRACDLDLVISETFLEQKNKKRQETSHVVTYGRSWIRCVLSSGKETWPFGRPRLTWGGLLGAWNARADACQVTRKTDFAKKKCTRTFQEALEARSDFRHVRENDEF